MCSRRHKTEFVTAFVVTNLLVSATLAADTGLSARASIETSAYSDDAHVDVLSPTISGKLESPTAGWWIRGSYLVDVVSAASPDIVATASPPFSEVRHAGSLDGHYERGIIGLLASTSVSIEPDYRSLTAGLRGTLDMSQKNFTWLFGYTFRHDTAGRTGTPFDVFANRLGRHDLVGGLSIVVNPRTIASVQLDGMFERGIQAKPYRYVPLFDPAVVADVPAGADVAIVNALRLQPRALEALPDRRDRYAVTASLAHRGKGATLRLEERLYSDTWGMLASTTDLRYVLDIGRFVSLGPHARIHAQTGVAFWQRATVAETNNAGELLVPAIRTGDRELGPLFTGTLGGGISVKLGSRFTTNLRVDGVFTSYLDALLLSRRAAIFSALSFDATFD